MQKTSNLMDISYLNIFIAKKNFLCGGIEHLCSGRYPKYV